MANSDRFGVEDLLGGFDEHLRRTRGVCAQTRGTYAMFVRAFLDSVSVDGEVRVVALEPRQVIDFIGGLARRYRPGTVELAASALRSFFRALRAQGLRGDRLEDAVPMVPRRRSGPARHLETGGLEQLIGSLRSSSPRDLRDRAIILCIARLGCGPARSCAYAWTTSIGATASCMSGPARPVTAPCCR